MKYTSCRRYLPSLTPSFGRVEKWRKGTFFKNFPSCSIGATFSNTLRHSLRHLAHHFLKNSCFGYVVDINVKLLCTKGIVISSIPEPEIIIGKKFTSREKWRDFSTCRVKSDLKINNVKLSRPIPRKWNSRHYLKGYRVFRGGSLWFFQNDARGHFENRFPVLSIGDLFWKMYPCVIFVGDRILSCPLDM